jgi:hypothetical protein
LEDFFDLVERVSAPHVKEIRFHIDGHLGQCDLENLAQRLANIFPNLETLLLLDIQPFPNYDLNMPFPGVHFMLYVVIPKESSLRNFGLYINCMSDAILISVTIANHTELEGMSLFSTDLKTAFTILTEENIEILRGKGSIEVADFSGFVTHRRVRYIMANKPYFLT